MKKPLSETEPLSLMISSRCEDTIHYQEKEQPMAVLRRDLKSNLEEIEIGGKQVFQVWIHEDESDANGHLGGMHGEVPERGCFHRAL